MGVAEDEMVGQHHPLNGHEFEQTPGDDEEQGSLVYCSSWDHKESDMTENPSPPRNPAARLRVKAISIFVPQDAAKNAPF